MKDPLHESFADCVRATEGFVQWCEENEGASGWVDEASLYWLKQELERCREYLDRPDT